MSRTLSDAVAERLTIRALTETTLALGVLWVVLDPSPLQFVTMLVSVGVVAATDVVGDAYDLRESVRHAGLGVYALLGGLGMVVLPGTTLVEASADATGPEALAVPVLFLLAGLWFVVDAVQTARHLGATRDTLDGRAVYREHVRHRVREALAERPRTRRELLEALDADPEDVTTAVQTLRDRGVVTRSGSELRLPTESRDEGRLDRLRDRLVAVGRRLARPISLERGHPTAESDDTSSSTDRTAPSADADGTDSSSNGTDSSSDVADSSVDGASQSADDADAPADGDPSTANGGDDDRERASR
ncbi:hypothetical protein RYH80_15885 [Halobaculum sp. MBLA0147]|uniref:hypothetical protein n=1 Tax=Halobaculum sp. MBLA0147 TaxID=3079934 RepID=UPI0035240AD4